MFKHGHESSQGGLISTTLKPIMSSTLRRTLNHHPLSRKVLHLLCRRTFFNHVLYNECSSIGTHLNLFYCL